MSKVENEGDITVTGDGEIRKDFHSVTDAAKGIDSSSGDIYNAGNIVAIGNGVYLEYESDYGTSRMASKAAQGIYASNAGVVKNEGNITVIGDVKDSLEIYASLNGAMGIYSSWKFIYATSICTSVND